MNVYDWSQNAKVGERVVYHRGENGPFGRIAASSLQAHREGLVFLAQRKIASGYYAYEATRISRRTAHLLGLLSAGAVSQFAPQPRVRRDAWGVAA